MYLVFEPSKNGFRFAAFAHNELLYTDIVAVPSWTPKVLNTVFAQDLLTKVRGHGKVFTKVGIIVPFAAPEFYEPKRANQQTFKSIASTSFLHETLQPVWLLTQEIQRAWPHIGHYFLFDTKLSHEIERVVHIPPFSYEVTQQLKINPTLLHSYGHLANIEKVKSSFPVISLYVGGQVSIALFEDGKLLDGIFSYSPVSPLLGLHNGPGLDNGFISWLVREKKSSDITNLLSQKMGLKPMTETDLTLDELFEVAGVSKRTRPELLDKLSIESIEWTELSVRQFIKSLRQALAGLMTHESEPKHLVINSSVIPEASSLWREVLKKPLNELHIKYCDTSLLATAAHDLENAGN